MLEQYRFVTTGTAQLDWTSPARLRAPPAARLSTARCSPDFNDVMHPVAGIGAEAGAGPAPDSRKDHPMRDDCHPMVTA